MAGLLSKKLGDAQSDMVTLVGAKLQSTPLSAAEQLALEHEDYKSALQYSLDAGKVSNDTEKIFSDDRDSARKAATALQDSTHASKLAKNIQPMLALMAVGGSMGLISMLCFGPAMDASRSQIIVYALGALTTISSSVINFYFGASKGDKDREKMLLEAVPATPPSR
jgi:hypothetical protein